MPMKNGRNAKFTIFYSSLPKDCSSFDLFEEIPEEGGFNTGLLSRNKTDVYSVFIPLNHIPECTDNLMKWIIC